MAATICARQLTIEVVCLSATLKLCCRLCIT